MLQYNKQQDYTKVASFAITIFAFQTPPPDARLVVLASINGSTRTQATYCRGVLNWCPQLLARSVLPVDSRDAARSLYGSDECHSTMTAEESQHSKRHHPRHYPHQATRAITIRHGIPSGARFRCATSDQNSIAVKNMLPNFSKPQPGNRGSHQASIRHWRDPCY